MARQGGSTEDEGRVHSRIVASISAADGVCILLGLRLNERHRARITSEGSATRQCYATSTSLSGRARSSPWSVRAAAARARCCASSLVSTAIMPRELRWQPVAWPAGRRSAPISKSRPRRHGEFSSRHLRSMVGVDMPRTRDQRDPVIESLRSDALTEFDAAHSL